MKVLFLSLVTVFTLSVTAQGRGGVPMSIGERKCQKAAEKFVREEGGGEIVDVSFLGEKAHVEVYVIQSTKLGIRDVAVTVKGKKCLNPEFK